MALPRQDTKADRKGAFLMRVGMGYDVHKLVEGRKLILGGVEIPCYFLCVL